MPDCTGCGRYQDAVCSECGLGDCCVDWTGGSGGFCVECVPSDEAQPIGVTERKGYMRISMVHPDQATRSREVATWLLPILATPSLTGRSFPEAAKCMIYLDGMPRTIVGGSWDDSGGMLYLPQERIGRFSNIDRLSILASIAAVTGATNDPRVVEAIGQRLTLLIKESAMSIYSNIIVASAPPKRLAINMENGQVAAEMNNTWALPGGTPVEVTDSWITLDF